jgi:hypothetical protein
MQQINSEFNGKARIWKESFPNLIYPTVNIVEKVVRTNLEAVFERKQVAIEILIPVGGRFLYGFLGVVFKPDCSGKLLLQVPVSTDTEKIFEDSIAAHLDQVRLGLPNEYVQSVIDSALFHLDKYKSVEILGSGTLCFEPAAHGELSSSKRFFWDITGVLVQLLVFNRVDTDHNSDAQIGRLMAAA